MQKEEEAAVKKTKRTGEQAAPRLLIPQDHKTVRSELHGPGDPPVPRPRILLSTLVVNSKKENKK